MRRRLLLCLAMSATLTSCTLRGSLRTDLSARPVPSREDEAALLIALSEAMEPATDVPLPQPSPTPTSARKGAAKPVAPPPILYTFRKKPTDVDIRRYLAAGFALTDIYCDRFFRETNQSFRRRKFGRTLTNDVGTAVNGILTAITTVPKNVLGGLNAVSGGLDSTWRNYDDAFVVAPELQNVRTLVLAAQDQFRQKTKGNMPLDYMTARSSITRYAGLCSFLGMQSLLNESLSDQREALLQGARPSPTPTATATTAADETAPTAAPTSRALMFEPSGRAGVIPPG